MEPPFPQLRVLSRLWSGPREKMSCPPTVRVMAWNENFVAFVAPVSPFKVKMVYFHWLPWIRVMMEVDLLLPFVRMRTSSVEAKFRGLLSRTNCLNTKRDGRQVLLVAS
jgi:hypothetical protein